MTAARRAPTSHAGTAAGNHDLSDRGRAGEMQHPRDVVLARVYGRGARGRAQHDRPQRGIDREHELGRRGRSQRQHRDRNQRDCRDRPQKIDRGDDIAPQRRRAVRRQDPARRRKSTRLPRASSVTASVCETSSTSSPVRAKSASDGHHLDREREGIRSRSRPVDSESCQQTITTMGSSKPANRARDRLAIVGPQRLPSRCRSSQIVRQFAGGQLVSRTRHFGIQQLAVIPPGLPARTSTRSLR